MADVDAALAEGDAQAADDVQSGINAEIGIVVRLCPRALQAARISQPPSDGEPPVPSSDEPPDMYDVPLVNADPYELL